MCVRVSVWGMFMKARMCKLLDLKHQPFNVSLPHASKSQAFQSPTVTLVCEVYMSMTAEYL